MTLSISPTLLRWLRFNSVGAIGTLVQLATLALFDHLAPHHTLLVTAAALELTLLHNFLWHRRFTWPTTAERQPWMTPLLRFHISNGLVSLTGNLLVMRLLVTQLHLPLLVSNVIAIALCSLANFWLSNVWAFALVDTTPALPLRLNQS
jgi:putative flippase GtrA